MFDASLEVLNDCSEENLTVFFIDFVERRILDSRVFV